MLSLCLCECGPHSPIATKGVRHRVEASISGANSCFDQDGRKSVVCSDRVRFDFRSSALNSNGTRAERGQFPEFLFTEHK